jgi:arylsulfatase A-like enzyme
LVVWDACRADHLTPYGYHRDTSPNLAAIAKDATVFDQAVAAAPWTIPSVASLFTGLLCHNHRVSYDPAKPSLSLTEEAVTLAEALGRRGYTTGLFTAQGIYYEQSGFLQGFDEHAHVREAELVERTLAFIDLCVEREVPAFVVAYWLSPHAPYLPKREHNVWYDSSLPPVNISPSGEGEGFVRKDAVNSGEVCLSDSQLAQLVAQYDGEIHQNDSALGELWKELETRGVADRCVFVLTADHGEGFNEHTLQRVWHDLPYETILRVPLIVRYPGRFPATRVGGAVALVDVYPTLVRLAGGRLRHPINGQDLRLALRRDAPDRPVAGATQFACGARFYRARGKKLMWYRTCGRDVELYDLNQDPGEQRDLARELTPEVRRMRRELAQFLAETHIPIQAAGTEVVPDAERQRLQALGYVQ